MAEPEALQLDDLRGKLIRQEETIIFALIERAQFGCNRPVYSIDPDTGIMPKGFNGSFLDFMLRETERLHALVRRYNAPDEMAFFPLDLPGPMLDALDMPMLVVPNAININRKIKSIYETQILPGTAPAGDDKNYGSSAVCDIACLQALSKRIHFGKFIAEAKFQANREKYSELIRKRDSDGLMAELTKPAVEKAVLARVRLKASTYGQDPQRKETSHKVEPDVIMSMYGMWVMPLTKEVQVAYLLQRLDPPVVGYVGAARPADRGFTTSAVLAAERCLARSAADAEHPLRFDAFGDGAGVIAAVLHNTAHYGVVSLETSEEGISRAALRNIARSGLFVTSDIWLAAGCVAVAPAAADWPPAAAAVTSVFGTQRNLGRCGRWIAQCCESGARVESTDDAAALSAMSATGLGAVAIVDGTIPIAELTRANLVVVADQVTDHEGRIRYAMVERALHGRSGNDRTSLVFAMDGRSPGELSSALASFQENKVNLAQIQSLPPEGEGSEYLFYVEADGHPEDPTMIAALKQLDEAVASHRIIGCYMRGGELLAALAAAPPSEGAPAVAMTKAAAAAAAAPGPLAPITDAASASAKVRGSVFSLGGLKVACLGPEGTYSHQAAVQHFGGDAVVVAIPTIEDVVRAVESGDVAYALVPWENSAGGAVMQAVAAIALTPCYVVHEVCSRIEHCLLFNGDLSKVTEVRSKAEALEQCADWLSANLPGARRIPTRSSAAAAQEAVAAAGGGVAAIASETAGALYGLAVLGKGVEDNHDNTTRFVLLCKEGPAPALAPVTGGMRSPFRTLLRLTPQDGAESLPAALAALARRAVPVLSVVAQPAGASWLKTYVVECAGHREDATVGAALDEIGRLCSSTRWLGSFRSSQS